MKIYQTKPWYTRLKNKPRITRWGEDAPQSAIPGSIVSVLLAPVLFQSPMRLGLLLCYPGRSDLEMELCCHGTENLNEVKENGAHVERLL